MLVLCQWNGISVSVWWHPGLQPNATTRQARQEKKLLKPIDSLVDHAAYIGLARMRVSERYNPAHVARSSLDPQALAPQHGASPPASQPPTPSAASPSKTLPRALLLGGRPACGPLAPQLARPLPRWLPLPFHQNLPPADGTSPGESSLPASFPVSLLCRLWLCVCRQMCIPSELTHGLFFTLVACLLGNLPLRFLCAIVQCDCCALCCLQRHAIFTCLFLVRRISWKESNTTY